MSEHTMYRGWLYNLKLKFPHYDINVGGPGSSVGIATDFGLDGPGIESQWGWIFRTCPERSWGSPSLLYDGYRVFPGGKDQPWCDADPSPLLVPWSRASRARPLLPLWAVQPVQCLYKGPLYFYLHKCWCLLCHGWEENYGFCIVRRYSKL